MSDGMNGPSYEGMQDVYDGAARTLRSPWTRMRYSDARRAEIIRWIEDRRRIAFSRSVMVLCCGSLDTGASHVVFSNTKEA